MARDLVLKYGFNIDSIRRTTDMDLGIEVKNWDEYQKLTQELLDMDEFEKSVRLTKKLNIWWVSKI